MPVFKYIYTLAEGLIERIFDEILKNIKTLKMVIDREKTLKKRQL